MQKFSGSLFVSLSSSSSASCLLFSFSVNVLWTVFHIGLIVFLLPFSPILIMSFKQPMAYNPKLSCVLLLKKWTLPNDLCLWRRKKTWAANRHLSLDSGESITSNESSNGNSYSPFVRKLLSKLKQPAGSEITARQDLVPLVTTSPFRTIFRVLEIW